MLFFSFTGARIFFRDPTKKDDAAPAPAAGDAAAAPGDAKDQKSAAPAAAASSATADPNGACLFHFCRALSWSVASLSDSDSLSICSVSSSRCTGGSRCSGGPGCTGST